MDGDLVVKSQQGLVVRDRVQRLKDGMATNTKRAYESALNRFYTAGYSVPATASQVADYVEAATGRQGNLYKVSTLKAHLAAINWAHLVAGVPSPTGDIEVLATLKAIRRERGSLAKKAVALVKSDIVQMLTWRHDNQVIQARDEALLLIMFTGAFRESEACAIKVEHLTWRAEGVSILLPSSKTDQSGEGITKGIPYAKGNICPVAALKRWLDLAGIGAGFVFRSVRRGGAVGGGLSVRSVDTVLRERARAAGLNHWQGVSGHSPRRGFVTETLVRMGVPAQKVQSQTGHKSLEMLSEYADMREFLDNPAQGLW